MRESVLPTARVRELQMFSGAVVQVVVIKREGLKKGRGGRQASQLASPESESRVS